MLVREMAENVAERQCNGEYRADIDPVRGGRLIIGVFDGIQLKWLYHKGVSIPEGLRHVVALLRVP